MESLAKQANDSKRAKQAFVFCCLILFVNISTCFIILSSDRLRRSSKFHIVISICVLSIGSCLVYFPVSVHQTLHAHLLGPLTVSFLQTTSYFVSPAITGLSITALSVDHMLKKNQLVLNKSSKILISLMGIALPWTFGLMAYLPCLHHQFIIDEAFNKGWNSPNLGVKSKYPNQSSNSSVSLSENPSLQNSTLYSISKSSIFTTISLWGVLPAIAAVTVTLSACFLCGSSDPESPVEPYYLSQEMHEDNDAVPVPPRPTPPCTIELFFTPLVYVLGNAPFLFDLVSLLKCEPDGTCFVTRSIDYTFALIRWAVYFLLPTVWLLDVQLREAIVNIMSKLCLKACVVY